MISLLLSVALIAFGLLCLSWLCIWLSDIRIGGNTEYHRRRGYTTIRDQFRRRK
jgi:hypothetical protein